MIQQLINFEACKPRFPVHPHQPYDSSLSITIRQFVQKYHHTPWIQLEDDIQYGAQEEFLRRYYRAQEFDSKIKLLGDYYRYHFEAPRMFLSGVQRIIEINTEDKRALQYEIVTQEVNRTKSCSSAARISTNRLEPHHKIIKDVELSYKDFQSRPEKEHRSKINEQRKNRDQETTKKQLEGRQNLTKRIPTKADTGREVSMKRVPSISHKDAFMVFKPKQARKPQDHKIKPTNGFKKPALPYKTKTNSQPQNSAKQKQKSSKMTSVNNSIASHKGLSRSKSKANLQIGSNKLKSKHNSINSSHQKLQKNPTSGKSSLRKNDSTRNMLSEKKNIPLSRNGSRNQLLKSSHEGNGKVSHKVITIVAGKKPKEDLENQPPQKDAKKDTRKMFNKAIEIRKRA